MSLEFEKHNFNKCEYGYSKGSTWVEHVLFVALPPRLGVLHICEMDTATLTGLLNRGLLHKKNSRLNGHLKGVL